MNMVVGRQLCEMIVGVNEVDDGDGRRQTDDRSLNIEVVKG